MSLSRSAVRWSAWCLAALGAEACLSGTDLVSPPRMPPTTITLEFRADSEDLASATALGWKNGIPGVQVTLAPEDSTSGSPQVFQGSDSGTLILDHLPGGRYVVDAVRWLTDSERGHLPPGDDAVGFVARVPFITASAPGRLPTEMVASRRRTVLFTEWAMEPAENPALGGYFYGGYVVIANNSDSTMYLDRMLLGTATSQPYEINGAPCADRIAFYSDPEGLWSAWIYQFPGTGQDYPIGPGERKLIATDAIDHRSIIADGYDLRGADFEFLSYSDVDNPDVPNLVSVGLREPLGGHGPYGGDSDVWYLALPTDLTSLPQGILPYTASTFVRIPGDHVLDVVTHLLLYDYAYPLCGTYVNPRFDRKTPRLLSNYMYGFSIQRLRTHADRTGPYQWTRSSYADFVRAPKTAPK